MWNSKRHDDTTEDTKKPRQDFQYTTKFVALKILAYPFNNIE